MNILIVDDDKLVAMSLQTILENTGQINVIAVGGNGMQAIELYRQHKPDVILMDIRMDGMSGIDVGREILREFSDAKILYLTTFSDDEYIINALSMGAKGYLLKQNFEAIAPSLEAVMRGQSVFGDKIIGKLPDLMKSNGQFDFDAHGITDKERSIIELVAEGLSNKEISAKMFLSEGTVRNYISTLLDKLGLRDRTQLAVFYYTEIKR